MLGTGRWLRLVSDDGWEYLERVKATGVVAIVAVTAASQLVLTDQFRKPVAASVIDLPAGLAGDTRGKRNENMVTVGKASDRRVRFRPPAVFNELADAPTSPGLTSEIVSFYLAIDLKRVGVGGGVAGKRSRPIS